VLSFACLADPAKCRPVVTFEDDQIDSALFSWSPDATKLAYISGVGLGYDEVTVGYYDSADWSVHPLARFEGDYLFVEWCPDGGCFLIEPTQPTDKPIVLVYVDGTLRMLPIAQPVGFMEVP
jgi:hypothetical protein